MLVTARVQYRDRLENQNAHVNQRELTLRCHQMTLSQPSVRVP